METNGQKSQPAAIKTRDGRLWFATTKGVVIFDPAHLPDNTNAPPVVIEQIRANGKIIYDNALSASLPHPMGEGRGEGSRSIAPDAQALVSSSPKSKISNLKSQIVLPPSGAHILEIQYTACTFIAPEKARFKYRLEGLDEDWIDAGTARKAYYANLRPGDYCFRVIAGNKHGGWNTAGASFAFHLQAHFYETWWFYCACAVGLFACAAAIYRWRVGELRRIQQLQLAAALLHERERLAKDLHDGLGGSLTQLTLLTELAEDAPRDPHNLQQRFRKVSRSTREALHAVRDLIWTAQPANDTLESLAMRTCEYAENLFAGGPTQCRFELPAPFPSIALTSTQRQQVLFAAKEALHNVAKHAAATEVHIRVTADPAAFTLTIEDNGCGFLPPGAQLENQKSLSAFHGLQTMRERIESLGGQFTLDSTPGRGTTISIQVPLKAAS